MKITINGEPQSFDQTSLSLADLLVVSKVETPDMVSVQINGKFVEKSAHGSTQIHDGDEVDFLYYLGGGASVTAETASLPAGRASVPASPNIPLSTINHQLSTSQRARPMKGFTT